jgi:transcriptional regulator with XRE-family HTH domain
MSRSALAARIGKTGDWVEEVELGQRVPGDATLNAMASALKIECGELRDAAAEVTNDDVPPSTRFFVSQHVAGRSMQQEPAPGPEAAGAAMAIPPRADREEARKTVSYQGSSLISGAAELVAPASRRTRSYRSGPFFGPAQV